MVRLRKPRRRGVLPQQPVQPEEFRSLYERVTLWVEHNSRMVLAGVVVFLLLVALGVGAYLLHRQSEQEAARLEWEAYRIFQEASQPPETPEEAQQRGVDYGKALVAFQALLKAYPGTDAAPLAQFYLGLSYQRLEQWQEAAQAFETLVQTYPRHRLVPLAWLALGYSRSQARDIQGALEAFQQAREAPDSPVGAQATFEMGRLWEAQGDLDRARSFFQEATQRYPGTSWALSARVWLNQHAPKEEATDSTPETGSKAAAPGSPSPEGPPEHSTAAPPGDTGKTP